ncbi:MAG: peptidoglycan DD-metalloendopeptidase family protein [Thermoanaerobaculia bacterium]|nr:peptidoglycan DD-metalloendopeptidase family protein [Thermoanaerobaculia bacterium]
MSRVGLVATAFLVSVLPTAVWSQSLETREAELEEIRTDIEELRTQVDEMRRQEQSLEDRLQRVSAELSLQEARLAEAAAALDVASLKAGEAETRVEKLEDDLGQVRNDLRRRLTGLYRLGRRGYLRLFLSLRAEQELLPALRQLRFLVLRDQHAIDRFVELRSQLMAEQEVLEQRRTEMARWQAEEASRRDELASKRDQRARVLARVTDKRRELSEQAQELEEKERKLTRFIDTLVADADDAEDAGEPEGTSIREFRGVLDWPVADPMVTIEFGPRRDPRYLTEVPHNGLGLEVEEGTRVRTVYPGQVLYAAEFEGYGPMVVVRHAGRVFTLYAGLQLLNVGPGDVLSLGDVLGASAESLYFEIRVENQPEDPRTWLR